MPRSDYENVLWVLDELHQGDFPGVEPPTGATVIGHDGAAWIVVRDDGEVWAVHPQVQTYVNASRSQFEETRRQFEARWNQVDRWVPLDEAASDELGEELRELVIAVDRSLADEFSWWMGVIDVVLL